MLIKNKTYWNACIIWKKEKYEHTNTNGINLVNMNTEKKKKKMSRYWAYKNGSRIAGYIKKKLQYCNNIHTKYLITKARKYCLGTEVLVLVYWAAVVLISFENIRLVICHEQQFENQLKLPWWKS